jgi:hypothetical protein
LDEPPDPTTGNLKDATLAAVFMTKEWIALVPYLACNFASIRSAIKKQLEDFKDAFHRDSLPVGE